MTDEIIFVRVPRAAVAIGIDDRIRTLFIVWATLGAGLMAGLMAG